MRRKAACKYGHEFNAENTYVSPAGDRYCRICRRARIVIVAGQKRIARHARGLRHCRNKTHCPSGHEYTPENTYINTTRPSRQCRECMRLRSVRYEVKRKAARLARGFRKRILPTHCPNGHEYCSKNTYHYVNKVGKRSRHCKSCRRLKGREQWEAVKRKNRAKKLGNRAMEREIERLRRVLADENKDQSEFRNVGS